MNAKKLINKHQKCIEILEAIQIYNNRILDRQWSIDFGFQGTFPSLRKKYKHDIDIYQMCINRLWLRYESLNKWPSGSDLRNRNRTTTSDKCGRFHILDERKTAGTDWPNN